MFTYIYFSCRQMLSLILFSVLYFLGSILYNVMSRNSVNFFFVFLLVLCLIKQNVFFNEIKFINGNSIIIMCLKFGQFLFDFWSENFCLYHVFIYLCFNDFSCIGNQLPAPEKKSLKHLVNVQLSPA